MKTRTLTIILTYLCFLVLTTEAFAQRNHKATQAKAPAASVTSSPQDASKSLLQRYEGRFVVMDSIVMKSMPKGQVLDTMKMKFVEAQRVEAIDRVVEAQIAAMKAETGVSVRGQAYIRPGKKLSYDPDDPLVAYNAKFQIDLEWSFFQSSLYKRMGKIKELQLKGEIEQLAYEKQAIDMTLVLQRQATRKNYYGHLLAPLRNHSENLTLLMETQTYLLRNGKISSDDLLKLINEKAELERQLVAIKADSIITELPTVPAAEYIQVDSAALMNHLMQSHLTQKKLAMQMDLLDARRDNIDYLQTMNIQPFVRYSYYNRENVHNTYNLDVGVSFKVPISAETSRKRKALQAEKEMVRYEQSMEASQMEQEIALILLDLHNHNENMKGEYARMKELKEYLAMRTNSYKNVSGDYSRIDRLQEYNAYLQSWERLLGYQYQRDMKLIDLQSYLTDEPLQGYLIKTDLK